MKRYLLFSGERYYPGGGWDDFSGSFDSVEEAKASIQHSTCDPLDWWHIVDSTTGTIIEHKG